MKTVAFVYARMDSSRLPSKALLPLAGDPMIDIVINRVKNSAVDECVLLTTSRSIDDPLVAYVEKKGVQTVRGHSTDLVDRTLQGISTIQATRFIRVNGDSPLFDSELATLALSNMGGAKFVSNLFERSFPYGIAIEIIDSDYYIEKAAYVIDQEREHVTQHLYRVSDKGLALRLRQKRDDSWLRLTVDTSEDYQRLNGILNHVNKNQSYRRIFNLELPELIFD